MKCPHCGATRIKVAATKHLDDLSIDRYRTCLICKQNWHTKESQTFKVLRDVTLLRDEKGKFLPQPIES